MIIRTQEIVPDLELTEEMAAFEAECEEDDRIAAESHRVADLEENEATPSIDIQMVSEPLSQQNATVSLPE